MDLTTDGILLIDKPTGWTSFDVVAKIRGIRKAQFKAAGITPTKRQLRVGHAGTLDPFATGLLIILLGDATKRSDEFLKQDKTYEATIQLGVTSTTGDPEGEITPFADVDSSLEHALRVADASLWRSADRDKSPVTVSRDESTSALHPDLVVIKKVLRRFTGDITQTPPIYSAIKIGGQRAYKLARKGKEVDIPSRQVTIHLIEVLDYAYPELKIRTHVSSGTYIRSLAVDIGAALGTGAYCRQLRRTSIGDMDISSAVEMSTLQPID